MNVQTLTQRYTEEILELWSTERRSARVLPRMARAARRPDVATSLRKLAWSTAEHGRRLERLFEDLGTPSGRHDASSASGIHALAERTLLRVRQGEDLDLTLIGLAQRLTHLRQAGYGIARMLAEKLGRGHDADALQASLEENTEMDFVLTRLVLFGIDSDSSPARATPEMLASSAAPTPRTAEARDS